MFMGIKQFNGGNREYKHRRKVGSEASEEKAEAGKPNKSSNELPMSR
jgi:hypothetical protein